jgi:hypothetical protein
LYTKRSTSRVYGVQDVAGLKLYSISASGSPVDANIFSSQLQSMMDAAATNWSETAGFAIFHQAANFPYLVLCWWGNDNELFVRVAVFESDSWVMDTDRFSFCLWDMEIMWLERRSYIQWMYSGRKDLNGYRSDLVVPEGSGGDS